MSFWEALLLGAVQGVTEFLPISSSGHLIFAQSLLGLNFTVLKSFDVVVHMGSLAAIFLYFSKEVKGLLRTFFGFLLSKPDLREREYEQLLKWIVLGTIPAVVIGLTLEDKIDEMFRSPSSVAMWMILIGIYFVVGERIYKKRKAKDLNFWSAVWIGFLQALALIPGVSRSGSTITMGMILGLSREKAARFSFLLGIPAISGAGLLTAMKMFKDQGSVDVLPMFLGFFSSFVFGLLSIYVLMKILKKHSLVVFAVYLIALGSGYLLI